MKYTARLPETNVNVTPTSPLKEFLILAGGLLGLAVGVYMLLGLAVNLIVPRVPPEFEKRMTVFFPGSMRTSDLESERAAYVQGLVDDLKRRCVHLPYDFRIHVRDSATVNALALPGGQIVVFSGLLDRVGSENELVFVLAHEMGHYAHRDHLKGLGRGLVLMVMSAFVFGSDSGVSQLLGRTLNLTELSFSRKQENRADAFGLGTLNCVYGHVAGATDFFEKIPESQDPGRFGHYFASHPENRRRITRLQNLTQKHGFGKGEREPLPKDLWKIRHPSG